MSYYPSHHQTLPTRFHCSFSKHCPYLGGESPGKVLAERNYLRQRVDEMESVPGLTQEEVLKLKESK